MKKSTVTRILVMVFSNGEVTWKLSYFPEDPKDPEEDDDLETPSAPTDATLPVEPFKIILVIGIAIAGIIFIGRKQKEQ